MSQEPGEEDVFATTSAPEDDDPLSHIGELLPDDELHDWNDDGVCSDCGQVR